MNKNIKFLEKFMNAIGKDQQLWDEQLVKFLEIRDLQTQRRLIGRKIEPLFKQQEQDSQIFEKIRLIEEYDPHKSYYQVAPSDQETS
mmetsp:Transcript_23617/g.23305  ORF Transcript_23617/g.23305 Transcript_23617/m.23305 type:complete len:87 (-) Transcript_23617:739-999(-)